jgi:hypothetical protein
VDAQAGSRSAIEWLAKEGEMGALMGSMNWAETPIGAVQGWSPTLRTIVKFLLVNRFPLLFWWRADFCQLYNDAYRPVLGTKHSKSLGQPRPNAGQRSGTSSGH